MINAFINALHSTHTNDALHSIYHTQDKIIACARAMALLQTWPPSEYSAAVVVMYCMAATLRTLLSHRTGTTVTPAKYTTARHRGLGLPDRPADSSWVPVM